MQALEDAVQKHKISISTPPPSNQHGKELNVVGRSQSPLTDNWVIDSGASHHMNSSKESFVSLGLSSIIIYDIAAHLFGKVYAKLFWFNGMAGIGKRSTKHVNNIPMENKGDEEENNAEVYTSSAWQMNEYSDDIVAIEVTLFNVGNGLHKYSIFVETDRRQRLQRVGQLRAATNIDSERSNH
ncbi:hypothetical protein KI387_044023 [Taxus chinensis]|uniref:Uncharacterized protein n=1 Tax=Taxus chinensis TaxID=29808 RepID=A0AA38G7A0_TAXCH|nr:hypothetical protein KI387_044023 [Taxus chinensis]